MNPTMEKDHLSYVVRKPKLKKDKTPLLILLHGVGSNERNMFSLAEAFPPEFLVISARGPLFLGENSFAWFQVQFTPDGPVINAEQAENSRKEILNFIEDLKQAEDFDHDQIYLLGFSQGGIMSYSVALTNPGLIKGIAVMSGRLLPEVKPMIATDDQLKDLKIFVSHGKQDQVLKFGFAEDAVEYLKSRNLEPEFHAYPEVHTINEKVIRDVNEWLLRKS